MSSPSGNDPRSARSVPESIRTFRISVHQVTDDAYGLTLDETYGQGLLGTRVVTATAPQTRRVLDAVVASVKASGHAASVLALQRDKPIPLDEAAGVRLSVTLFATQPITKNDRIRAMVAGVNAMSIEETYYWYAKCVGPEAARCRRALRVMLADDRPGA